jgi:hypothetical protein
MKTYTICTNDETLFSGQEDANGEMIQLDIINLDVSELSAYAMSNGIEIKCESNFQYWNGGYGHQNGSQGVNTVEEDEHADALRGLLKKAVAAAIENYNEMFES